jgi:LmbE family N-acetylglucosaminyl deacetylase
MSESFVTTEELIRPERHLFLSPHYDDIALSCGGTAALVADSGRRPEVVLIFGDHPDPDAPMTGFAEELHAKWGLSAAEVIAGRRAEEAAAADLLGADTTFLPFRDAIYRGERYQGDDQLFGPPRDDESELPGRIVEAAGLGGQADPRVRVYAPLAIGNHVDHQHAYAAGRLLGSRGWQVWFYEDLPYGLKPELASGRKAAIASQIGDPRLVDVGDVWDRKVQAILAYPSQLRVIFEEYVGIGSSQDAIDAGMGSYARVAGDGRPAERFWLPRDAT